MHMIPRKFFMKQFETWKSGGYSLIDFTNAKVDLSAMPHYYQKKYKQIQRNIEKNYFLNHLIYHKLARVQLVKNTYYFEPDFLYGLLNGGQVETFGDRQAFYGDKKTGLSQ